MNPIRTIALLIACSAGWVWAGEDKVQDLAASHDSCPSLMTETECRAHHRILQTLPAGEERQAYLTMHAQLLDERQAACGCSRTDKLLSLADMH